MIDLRGGEGGRQAAGGRATYTLLLSSLSTNFAFGDSEEFNGVVLVPQQRLLVRILMRISPPCMAKDTCVQSARWASRNRGFGVLSAAYYRT